MEREVKTDIFNLPLGTSKERAAASTYLSQWTYERYMRNEKIEFRRLLLTEIEEEPYLLFIGQYWVGRIPVSSMEQRQGETGIDVL